MNIKAIIASLVLGSSSVAMASPGVTVSATAQGSYGTTVVRDHRFDDNRYAPVAPQPAAQPTYQRQGWHGAGWDGQRKLPPVYRPVTLASGLRFANNGRTFITVDNQAGRFETLQISAARGRTLINQVYVQFDNGQTQVIRNLNRTLAANQSLTLDLDGARRSISRIVVYGRAINTGFWWMPSSFTVTAS